MLGHREKRDISAWLFFQPPPSLVTHPCPAHLSVTPSSQGLSGTAGTSDRVGANFCPKTSLSQLCGGEVQLQGQQGGPLAWHHLPPLASSVVTYQNRRVPHSQAQRGLPVNVPHVGRAFKRKRPPAS